VFGLENVYRTAVPVFLAGSVIPPPPPEVSQGGEGVVRRTGLAEKAITTMFT